MCKKPGHRRFKCPVLNKYGAPQLPPNNLNIRMDLSTKIGSIYDMSISLRPHDDKRIVMKEIPKKMMALVIHKKYYIENYYSQTVDSKNICVECTWIVEGGYEHPTYKKSLFTAEVIQAHVTRTKTNLIVSLL